MNKNVLTVANKVANTTFTAITTNPQPMFHDTIDVNAAAAQAKAIVTSGLPLVCNRMHACVPLNAIYIDMGYQRESGNSTKLRKNFDIQLMMPIVLSYRDGLLFNIDGNHRAQEFHSRGGTQIEALINFNMTFEDEARCFNRQNSGTTTLKNRDLFKSGQACSASADVDLATICDALNISVAGHTTKQPSDKHLTALADARNISMTLGMDGLVWIFGVMDAAEWFTRDGGCAAVLKALKHAYITGVNEGNLDAYAANLIANLSKTDFKTFKNAATAHLTGMDWRTSIRGTMLEIARGMDIAEIMKPV